MLIRVDKTVTHIVIGLGVLFTALTPIFVKFPSPDGILFIGATRFLPFLGFLNLARIKSQRNAAKTLSVLENSIAAIYLLAGYFIVNDATALVALAPVLVLCYTSWKNPRAERPEPSPRVTTRSP